jgi:hypothetical protein
MFKRITLLILAVFAVAASTALADEGGKVKGPFWGTVHAVGTIDYKDASTKSWTWDRGRITALSSSSITLTRRDKAQVTFALTSSTAVRNDGGTYTLADLHLGLVATVISQDGNAVVVRRIRGDGAPSGAEQSTFDGPAKGSVTGSIDAQYYDGSHQTFEYDRGRITKLGDGQLTVVRPDKKTVTFTYDETTLVRDKGQLESVDDLEVGEGAMFFSQGGALKLVRCIAKPKADAAQTPAQAQAPAPAPAPATK